MAEELDERIAALERSQRLADRSKEQQGTDSPTEEAGLSVEEARLGIQKGKLRFPGGREYAFKTAVLFPEKIPLTYMDGFYPDQQETEDMVIYVNNEEGVGQTLVHLPEEMAQMDMDAWAKQIEDGMKENGLFAEIVKKESLPHLDYVTYRTPSKKGWIYNILFRICKRTRNIVGAYNCLEKDRGTYGQLIEALVLELQGRIKAEEG